MKHSKLAMWLGGTLLASTLASLSLPAQAWPFRPVVVVGQPAVIVAPPIVVAPPVVVAAPVVVEPAVVAYVPGPFDVYLTNVAPADVVIIGGDTYFWSVDVYGHRVRHFYGHGDRRQDVFRRHEELQRVAARNGGHLPAHGESRAAVAAHQQQRGAAGGAPAAHAGGAPAAAEHPGGAAPAAHAAGGGAKHK